MVTIILFLDATSAGDSPLRAPEQQKATQHTQVNQFF